MSSRRTRLPHAAEVGAVIASLGATLAVAHGIFSGYFPGPRGLGHDYSYFFPNLLANYYWAKVNGPWSPPWFTPAFCGGQPSFPDPQSLYYSLPQALVAYLDPVASVYATFLAFIALGFLGTYLLLRQRFNVSVAAALTGALVFALNGFFSHRMMVGHLAFHGIMLVPWLAVALIPKEHGRPTRRADALLWGTAGGLVLAYWVVSGMVALAVPALLAATALVLAWGLARGSLAAVPTRAVVAGVVGLGLSASKVAGVLAYTKHVPRTAYPLPAMTDAWATVKFAATALFVAPADLAVRASRSLTNVPQVLDRHEFELGITAVPAVLLGIGLATWVFRQWRARTQPALPGSRGLVTGLVLLLVLALPVAANTHGPQWQAFLKSLPLVGSSSTLFRWFLLYIPVIAVASALAVDSLCRSARMRAILAIASCAAVVGLHGRVDRELYATESYDPGPVANAFRQARAPDYVPSIRRIGAHADSRGIVVLTPNRNDLLTQRVSQLICYNPMFGYSGESFPIGPLRQGDPLEERDGFLNLKNPACYLFPQENGCSPGSHFPAARRAEAQRFLGYHGYPFERSAAQQWADAVNRGALLGVPVLFLAGFAWRLRRGKRPS